MSKETYDTETKCSNCGDGSALTIAKGTTTADHLRGIRCYVCDCATLIGVID